MIFLIVFGLIVILMEPKRCNGINKELVIDSLHFTCTNIVEIICMKF